MLVTLGRFLVASEAQVLRMRLEAEGIPAFEQYTNHSRVNWPIAFALGGTTLQVPEECLDDARAILADFRSGAFEADLRAETGLLVPSCANCGSEQLRTTIPWSRRILALMMGLWGALIPTHTSLVICRSCGNRWQAD